MRRNDIKKHYFKGEKITVNEITRKATYLGFSDATDADYTESEAYRIAEVLREELPQRHRQPTKPYRSKVISFPFPAFRQAGNEQFDYWSKLVSLLRKKFNDDLDKFEQIVLNDAENAAELATSIDQLLRQIEAGEIQEWSLKGVKKPKFNTSLSDIYPARLTNALRNRL